MTIAKIAATDRFTALPIVIALLVVGLFFWLGYTSINFQSNEGLEILVLAIALGVVAADAVILVLRLARRRWRAATSITIALILLIGCWLAKSEIYFQIDRMRFAMFRDHYVTALKTRDPADVQSPKAIRWGFWGHFLSGEFYRRLVYDETDEIATVDLSRPGRARDAVQDTVENVL